MTHADAYNKLEDSAVVKIIPLINPILEGTEFSSDKTTILEKKLPFYKDYSVLDISNHADIPITRRFVLKFKETYIALDFTNTPIYNLNAKGVLILNAETVIPYVRFFFEFVRGKKGHFQIIDSLDDILWLEEPSAKLRRSLAPNILPMIISHLKEDGTFVVEGTMIFKDCLIQAKIEIDQKGFITMKDQKIIESNLAIKEAHIGP